MNKKKVKCEICDSEVQWSKDEISWLLGHIRQNIEYTNKNVHTLVRKIVRDVDRKLDSVSNIMESWDQKVMDLHGTCRLLNRNVMNCEEALLNVLLAIRQNEYLQAWYPAQKGHQEMKVVGSHPAVKKRMDEEQHKNLNEKVKRED